MASLGRNDPCICGSGKKFKYCCLNKKDNREQKLPEFSMSEDDYKTKYFPIYSSFGVEPDLLIQFSIVLPYELPFNEGMCQTMLFENFAISFRFSEIEVDEGYKYGIPQGVGAVKRYVSRVEMTYGVSLSIDEFNREKEKCLNEYFDSLLSKLNILITSYQVSKKDTDVHYITKEMLQVSVPVRVIPVSNWGKLEFFLFMLHTNISYKKERLTVEEQSEITRHSEIIELEVNPFILAENFILNAKRFFKNGFYLEAVIYAQTGVETFIRALYKEFLSDEGLNESDIVDKLENTPFMGIIKREISNRIGGLWDISRNDSEVGKWYECTYSVRNKVVHSGYIPNFQEADSAIYYAIELRYYIKKLLEVKKNKYDRINSYFHYKQKK